MRPAFVFMASDDSPEEVSKQSEHNASIRSLLS